MYLMFVKKFPVLPKIERARALLRELGVKGAVRSPTYTLVERYFITGGEAAHLDLYRLASAAELDFLGLDELAAYATLWLIEWPERAEALLPEPRWDIMLAPAKDPLHRIVSFAAVGDAPAIPRPAST